VDRYDGIQQYLRGTYDAALTGARVFAVVHFLGDGGQAYGRVFGSGNGGEDYTAGSFMILRNNVGTVASAHQQSFRISDPDGYQGSRIFEYLLDPVSGSISFWVNGELIGTSVYAFTLDPTEYAIANRYSEGDPQAHAAIDVEAILVFPPDADPEPIRAAIIAKYPLP
jgi:hypothetical protein